MTNVHGVTAHPGGARRRARRSVRRRDWSWVAVTAAGALASATLVTLIDPNEPGHYPTCPVLFTTGYYCPGCGALRAAHDLFGGDLAGAFARNPLIYVIVPVGILAWANLVARASGRSYFAVQRIRPWSLYAVLALVIVYGVLRNLPGWTLLSPA